MEDAFGVVAQWGPWSGEDAEARAGKKVDEIRQDLQLVVLPSFYGEISVPFVEARACMKPIKWDEVGVEYSEC